MMKDEWGRKIMYKGYELRGWVTPDRLRQYTGFIEGIKGGIIVEVGVYGGASLLPLVDLCTKNENKLYGIDPWEKNTNSNGKMLNETTEVKLSEFSYHMKKNRLNVERVIRELKYEKTVTIIHDFSVNAVKQFKDGSVDVVYIDGNHDYKSVMIDLQAWSPKVKINGGTLWGDDFQIKEVQQALSDFTEDGHYSLKNLGSNGWQLERK